MTTKSSLFLLFLLPFTIIHAQNLFVEEKGWPKEESLLQLNVAFKFESTIDTIKNKSVTHIKYYYPNGQIAIEGSCKNKYKKTGTWNFYYETGKLWSTRTYYKNGLKSIDVLLNSIGDPIESGYARPVGRYQTLSGHNYIYDKNNNILKIIRYRGGVIYNSYEKDQYSKKQLKRLVIREFETNGGEILEETSLEEAIELQKNNPKPIFLNVTNYWNGYSNKGYKKLFSDPEIAAYINEHYHLAYLDLDDSHKISFSYQDSTYNTKVSSRKGFLPLKLGIHIRSTPTFVFIDQEIKVMASLIGIEMKKEDFMKQMTYVAEGYYKNLTWNEYFNK